MNKENFFKMTTTGVATVATFLFGKLDTPLYCLLIFMIIDFLTGYIKGWYLGQASSKTGFKGLAKKGFMLLIVVIATLLDRLTNTQTFLFRTTTCFFYCSTEAISILENAYQLQIPIPKFLTDKLIQIKDVTPSDSDISKENTNKEEEVNSDKK